MHNSSVNNLPPLRTTVLPDRPIEKKEGDLINKDNDFIKKLDRIAETIAQPLLNQEAASQKLLFESITFAIYGKWGMGKSSALQLIAQMAYEHAAKSQAEERIKFCQFSGPTHESLRSRYQDDVRTMLVIRILMALSNDNPRQAIELFSTSAERFGLIQTDIPLPSQQDAPDSLGWNNQVIQNISKVLARQVEFHHLLKGCLDGTLVEDGLSRVLVVLVDDLDRCHTEFVWEVLDTIQHLSIPNLFFVIAVQEEQLKKAVAERFDHVGGGATDPTFALEKYVQQVVWVPEMDERRLKDFIKGLVDTYYGEEKIVGQAIKLSSSYLQHGLRVLTPRSVKRCLNTIYFDLEIMLTKAKKGEKEEQRRIVKERILEYTWPEFYNHSFLPAKKWQKEESEVNELSGAQIDYRKSLLELEKVCRTYSSNKDEEQLQISLRRISTKLGLNWGDFDLKLAYYLGLTPYLLQAEKQSPTNPVISDLSGKAEKKFQHFDLDMAVAGKNLQQELLLFYYKAETAHQSSNQQEVLQHIISFYNLLREQNYKFDIGGRYASVVGDMALLAENLNVRELANNLFEVALELDPEHSNNLQNYISFIIDAQIRELYSQAKIYILKLKSERHKNFKPERTIALESRLANLLGEKLDRSSEALTNPLLEEFLASPHSQTRYIRLMRFLREIGDVSTARKMAQLHYQGTGKLDEHYIALRYLASVLAFSSSDSDRREALELYRYLLTIFSYSEQQLKDFDSLHRYASLLYSYDYDTNAALVWIKAYKLLPTESAIQNPFAECLGRLNLANLAAFVLESKPLPEELNIKAGNLPQRFVNREVELWWETHPDTNVT